VASTVGCVNFLLARLTTVDILAPIRMSPTPGKVTAGTRKYVMVREAGSGLLNDHGVVTC
jgi:hypothetical protein